MALLHFYKKPGISDYHKEKLLKESNGNGIRDISTELCFNVGTLNNEPLTDAETQKLSWLLAETFEQENFSTESFLKEVHFQLRSKPSIMFLDLYHFIT
jgi:hypothetical protein